jgi:hypothetical protein
MPPAFNLSQDQTLQFNTCTRLHSSDVNQAKRLSRPASSRARQPSTATQPASFSMSTSRDAYRALKAPSPPAPPESPPAAPARQSPKAAITPSTHTYRLFTLLKSVRPAGFCQTDAKRRDYTTFRSEVKGNAQYRRISGALRPETASQSRRYTPIGRVAR